MAQKIKDTPKTWGEFKAAVEALGVTDADEIWYIDWSGIGPPPTVERNDGKVTFD
jgi:hypothetical protein